MVQAAKRNGIVTASERPNTVSKTRSAIGNAMPSPFFKSFAKMGSRSAWIAGWPVT